MTVVIACQLALAIRCHDHLPSAGKEKPKSLYQENPAALEKMLRKNLDQTLCSNLDINFLQPHTTPCHAIYSVHMLVRC